MKMNKLISGWPAVAGVSVLLLSLGTMGIEITKIDIRFALMVQDMALHGIGVFSTINGVAYGDYPSGWLVASYLTTLGGNFVTHWLFTLPTILAGAFMVTMTYLTGERLGKNTGLLAAVFLLITPEFIHLVSGFGIDAPVAAAGITMLYLLQSRTKNRISCCIWILLLVFCFLVRGPLGIVLLGSAAGGYLLASRRWKSVFLFGLLGLVTAVLCGIGWYWAIHRQGGEQLWQEFLRCQIGKRMGDSNYLEYFISGLPSFAPVSLLAFAVFFLPRKQVLSEPVIGWLGFLLLPLIILSIPGCKHMRYMGITLPAFALLAAYSWNGRRPWCFVRDRFPRTIKLLFRMIPVCAFAGIIVLAAVGCALTELRWLPWWHFLLAALLIGLLWRLPARGYSAIWRTTLPFIIFLTVALIPFEAALENSQAFVTKVESSRRGLLYLYNLGPDHDDLKYVFSTVPEKRNQIRYLFDEKRHYSLIIEQMYPHMTTSEGIKAITKDDLLILRDSRKDRESLQLLADQYGFRIRPIWTGPMGHRDFLAVQLIGNAEKNELPE